MQNLPDNSSGIPVVVAGIPTVQTSEGIVSPFPYLNSDSEEWKGSDEDEGGFDTDGGVSVRSPHPDDDWDGGDEADLEDDEDDYDDDMDMGFGAGIGLLSTLFTRPAPFLPA